MNEYLKLVDEAQQKRIRLTKKQTKNIKDLYRDVAKELGKRAKRANKGSLSERWLVDYQKQFKSDIKELNKVLRKDIESSMLKSAEYATGIQVDFFNLLNIKYKLDSKEHFSNMFSKIPEQALEELISGEFYKDGKGLSRRLWFNGEKANADFDYIIQKGLVEKKSTYELAKDLSDYVNPEVKKDWDFKKIYPGVGNKKIEYNSFRLAVTSISHAYQLSMQRSCKANPFVEGIEWHTSNSHRGPCALCQSREGKIYKPDELPLDHPNGVCYFTPVITKSMEDIGSELHDWLYGESNNRLDDWYKEYGREFAGESNLFGNISKKDNNNDDNSDIMKTGAFSGALNPESKEAENHAKQYYESVRHMKTDTVHISKNTGWKKEAIDKIKKHVFIKKHDLGNNKEERFFPSYDMAQSWQRLIEGKNIKEQDIVLLKHEYLELTLMKNGLKPI